MLIPYHVGHDRQNSSAFFKLRHSLFRRNDDKTEKFDFLRNRQT